MITRNVVQKVRKLPAFLSLNDNGQETPLGSHETKFILAEMLPKEKKPKFVIVVAQEVSHLMCAARLQIILEEGSLPLPNPSLFKIRGGGVISRWQNRISVGGQSRDCGSPDWKKVRDILQLTFPECELEFW